MVKDYHDLIGYKILDHIDDLKDYAINPVDMMNNPEYYCKSFKNFTKLVKIQTILYRIVDNIKDNKRLAKTAIIYWIWYSSNDFKTETTTDIFNSEEVWDLTKTVMELEI